MVTYLLLLMAFLIQSFTLGQDDITNNQGTNDNGNCEIPYLLSIMTSQRGDQSYSIRMGNFFLEEYQRNFPDHRIRDVEINSIPHLTFDAVEAGRTDPKDHSENFAEAFKLASSLTDDLLGCSHLLIATPMYNWGMPSALKAWFDRVINFKTFYAAKPLGGIPVTVIISSGGAYTAQNNGRVHMDHLRSHIITCLTQCGVHEDDITFINIEPTWKMDQGVIERDNADSPFQQAKMMLPEAAKRIKQVTCKTN